MRSLDLKRSKLWMTACNAECFSSTYKFEENNKTLDIRDVDESTRVKHTVKISQKITKMMWNQPLLPRHIQPILELMLHCQDQPTKQISIYFSFRQVITNQKTTSTSITKEVRGEALTSLRAACWTLSGIVYVWILFKGMMVTLLWRSPFFNNFFPVSSVSTTTLNSLPPAATWNIWQIIELGWLDQFFRCKN